MHDAGASPSRSVRIQLAVLLTGILPMAGNMAFAAGPETALLAADGKALMPVVVGTNPAPRVRAAATNLAAYLTRISGAVFEVKTGDVAGVLIGVPADFPQLPEKIAFPGGPFGREDYVLRSRKDGVCMIGATEIGVEHAAWDLLYRLGHRQFFPGRTWEVVPGLKKMSVAVDVNEHPAIYSRRIWYNWGFWGYNETPYREWCARNRHGQGFLLNSGHSYEGIIGANRTEFDVHPEYLSLVNGQRMKGGDAKFCISNPGLRQLVVDHAVRLFKAHSETDSISMDPSDGSNWCECEECAKLGSVSDRAVTLANAVAEAINRLGLGTKYVGMYAYNRHCGPPSIAVHSNVIISATTAFITGGYTLDQIITGWQARGATIGIYDYYSVIDWDWNLPGRARAARPAGVASAIVDFHRKGARFYDCESGDAWGPYGLAYYVAARTMWDTNEAARVDALTEDFLTQAFGPAKEPMRGFYRLINFDDSRRSSADLVGRMYRFLAEACKAAAGKPDVIERIDHLVLYTHYVELYNAFAAATGEAHSKLRDPLVTYVYRMRKTMMIHAYGFWARTVGQNAALQTGHPLKNEDPFTQQEIQAFVDNGIAANQPVEMGFKSITFTDELVPADPLKLPDVAVGSFPPVPQDCQTYHIWVPKAPADVKLKVTVQRVWALRPHHVRLFSPLEVTGNAVVDSDIVKPDGTTYDVILRTPHEGRHRVEIVDGGDYTRIAWPEGTPVTLPSGIDTPGVFNHFRGGWNLYCYVPKGAASVGGWAARIAQWAPRISGTLKDADGNVVHDFGKMEGDGWFNVPVAAGHDGRLWKFENSQGVRQLMTVPPYLARNGKELLLPREVVEKDSK